MLVKDLAGKGGIEPPVSESKSEALPVGHFPLYAQKSTTILQIVDFVDLKA